MLIPVAYLLLAHTGLFLASSCGWNLSRQ